MALNGVVESKGNPYTKAGADKRITKYYHVLAFYLSNSGVLCGIFTDTLSEMFF